MHHDSILILAILAATMGLFLWGRWRHDVVALTSLLACTFAGLIDIEGAFLGFGHPAVITVACVLVLSRGLQTTGAVDILTQRLLPRSAGPTALIVLGALLSAFMNNVGAMALLMPIAIQVAAKHDLPPGKVLMPLAFGTILGGMTTLIGTPPNLIVAGFRDAAGVGSFRMFDYSPVGFAVAAAGILLLVLLGRRIVPTRAPAGVEGFDTGAYFTEVRIPEGTSAVGLTLEEVERELEEADAQVVAMVRNDFRVATPNPRRVLRPDDILVIEAEPESLAAALTSVGLTLEGAHKKERLDSAAPPAPAEEKSEETPPSETVIQEVVPLPASRLIGRSAARIRMRARYGLNLLAISRRGSRSIKRLRTATIQAGDVLLMQGAPEALSTFAAEFNLVPLAPRDISIPDRNRALIAMITMGAAIGSAALGLLPAALAFAAAVLTFILLRVISPRQVYDAIDWPVIVLLGALMPVAGAMASTGAADLLAQGLLRGITHGHPVIALALILIVTMTLSDFMNNAATAAVMCPIALSTAAQLGVNPDAFLMAVAIGASCAFLTPIGHQNNTLILGPGGFRFGDYWRLGLPMEILVIGLGIPMLLLVWPL